MLEKIDLSKKVDKKTYRRVMDEAEEKLGLLQRECKDAGIPVILVFEGMGAAGKGVQINRLIQALDPRGFDVYASSRVTEDEAMRPFLWRFWTLTPENGRIAVFDRSWYRKVREDRFEGRTAKKELAEAFRDICSFEKQLTDSKAVIIKLFLYISREEQKKRFKKLEESGETAWRVTKEDWKRNEDYDRYLKINEEMLERTDTEYAPWTIIEATDKSYGAMKILKTVTETLEDALAKTAEEEKKKSAETLLKAGENPAENSRYQNGVLSGIDLSKTMTREAYKKEIDRLQKKLELLHSELYRLRIPVVLGFEGWDAGGKGGAIRRLTSALDPLGYKVNPVSAPNDIEKAYHYLWRFWTKIPEPGEIAVFDRTWYGRVLVERVEHFTPVKDWKRGYEEINEMEEEWAKQGFIVQKFWMHIDPDEQFRRFKAREEDPDKTWKITAEDWRNRDKWDAYVDAVNEMLYRTDTPYAPWTVVEGNNKYYARLKVMSTMIDRMEKALAAVDDKAGNKAKKG